MLMALSRSMTRMVMRFTTRTMMVMNVGKNTMPRETVFTQRAILVLKLGLNTMPRETRFTTRTVMVLNT